MVFKKLILSLFLISIGLTQEIPGDFLQHDDIEYSLDLGQNWNKHTLFGIPRFSIPENQSELNTLQIQSRIGIHTINESIALFGFGHFRYNTHFYGYLYPRIVNDIHTFPRYSGIPRDISRKGFVSGETDLSGIGFENNWIMIQWGRGREDWSSGRDISLALSENSPAYDYGTIKLDFGSIRVKYIHGFLETLDSGINRYITGRGIEYTNQKSLLFGLSETVIYSGMNRPIDLGYINPMSTHLEIELNNRLNQTGNSDANAVWQASLDWLATPQLRLSGNILFDEFVIDEIEKEAGKEHGLALSGRLAYQLKPTCILFVKYVKVGTPTFRHGQGSNNFVIRDFPLGWQDGSDGQDLSVGLNFNFNNTLFSTVEIGQWERGNESITSNPYHVYTDYLKGPFPSGNVISKHYIKSKIKWQWKDWIQLQGQLNWDTIDEVGLSGGVYMFFPKEFSI